MTVGIITPYAAMDTLRSAAIDARKASERISTGLRINSASDDPVGLARANQLKVEISSFTEVKRNLSSATSLVEQVGDSLMQIADILSSMEGLAKSASTATDSTILANYQTAFSSYREDINRIASATSSNGSSVLDGTTPSVSIQVGIESGDTKTLTFFNSSSTGLSLASLDLTTGAAAAYTAVGTAMDTTNSRIATVGAYQNSIEGIGDFVDSMILNKSVEYTDLVSADLALEATNLAAAQIRQDASMAMVAQTNSMSRELVDFLLDSVID